MDNRAAIPVLALLGLSFTDCKGSEPASTIVGEWHAVEIDGDERPLVEGEGTITERYGFELVVEDDLDGHLSYYTEVNDGPLTHRSEYGGELVVDDAAAPTYKLVVDDFIGLQYEDANDSYGSYGSTGAPLDDGELARPIAAPHEPGLALPTFTLSCTLAGDLLTCEREGAQAGDDLRTWVFARNEPDGS